MSHLPSVGRGDIIKEGLLVEMIYVSTSIPCADPECFVRGGPTLTTFFFSLMGGGTISGPSSDRQRNAI